MYYNVLHPHFFVLQRITMYYKMYYNVLQRITMYYNPFLGYVIQRITLYYFVLQWLIQQSDWESCAVEINKKRRSKIPSFFYFLGT